jgi:hypothetical protein
MIKSEKLEIIIYNKQLKHYNQYFSDRLLKQGDKIVIDLYMLTEHSKQKIDVMCDICGNEKNMNYKDYKRITNDLKEKYYCKKCKWIKTKETNMNKYGCENVFQNNEIKEKIKITNIEIFGVDHPLKNESVKQKRKETNTNKFGFEHHLQNKEILSKLQHTNILKYGNKCSLINDEVKLKTTQTNLEKYGVDIPLKNKTIIEKLIQTNNIRYGDNSPLQNVDIHNKSVDTLFENYGVSNPLKSEYIKDKVKKTKINNLFKKYENLDIININYDTHEYEFKCDCNKEHNFLISSNLLYNRLKIKTILCTICNQINSYNNSGMQIQLYEYIKNNYDKEILINNRNIINPHELDIYLPELKLAFEFNGLFWHNELNKDNNYHYNKTEICEAQGIHLIHIYEDDWIYKQEIVKSRILNLLGKNVIKLYARKCIIKECNNSEIRDFLNTNHLQGFVGSQFKLGLYYNNELVSLMIFGKQRKPLGSKNKDDIFEMLRFCNKINTTVVGGANKLFNYFVKNYKPKEVISYADRSWSQGNLYKVLGFEYMDKTKPNYYYIVDGIREYRFNYRKDILIKQGFEQYKSEHEIMLERKIYRIYDSGSLKYIYKI